MPPELRLGFLGHSALTIELGGTLLLTDPILRRHIAFLRWTAPRPELDPLDGVAACLVSHLHLDHCDPASLWLLGRRRRLVVPAGTAGYFRRHGFTDVVALRPGETHVVGGVTITATFAAHDGRRLPLGPRGEAVGFVLEADGLRVYFAGDTDLFPQMRDLSGDLDVALLPVSGWGRTVGPGHLDPVRAVEATAMLAPSLVVPMHWGALRPFWHGSPSEEIAAAAPTAYAVEVERRRLPAEVAVLAPGDSLTWRPTDAA